MKKSKTNWRPGITEFTNQQLIDQAREEVDFWRERDEIIPSQQTAIRLRLAEITLAALTAEPVYFVEIEGDQDINAGRVTEGKRPDLGLLPDGINHLYAAPPAPVVLDGYVLVPIIPTEDMIINGFEAELREEFRDPEALETYEKMSGCELAAHRTKLCWAAMIAAAPQQERKI